jgi:hypothetical protein
MLEKRKEKLHGLFFVSIERSSVKAVEVSTWGAWVKWYKLCCLGAA